MQTLKRVKEIIKNRFLVIDGAMGTQIQSLEIPQSAWKTPDGKFQEGCNELLNVTAPEIIQKIHRRYATIL